MDPSPTQNLGEDNDDSSLKPSVSFASLTSGPTPTPAPPVESASTDPMMVILNPDGTPYRGRYLRRTIMDVSERSKKKRSNQDGSLNLGNPSHQERAKQPVRRRSSSEESLADELPRLKRQSTNYPACDDQGNNILSCYPTSDTTVYQGQWTKFIWNARIPEFIGLPSKVDIYLYHADSGEQVQSWTQIENVRSQINVLIDDDFWDYRSADWEPGKNLTYTYYFVIVKSGSEITGGEPRQATWTAVQTRLPDSVISESRASASSTASVMSLSTASATLTGSATLNNGGPSTTGGSGSSAGLQGSGNGNDFPAWAIALLAILGFLALSSLLCLAYILIRQMRRRRLEASSSDLSHRNSMGSSSPMMAQATSSENPHSPTQLAQTGQNFARGEVPIGLGMSAAAISSGPLMRTSSYKQSNVGDASSARSVSDAGPISGQDALIMADAFRNALRKPDFAERPTEEGESPDTGDNGNDTRKTPDVFSRELAEEGAGLRSVSSQRGVRVETGDERGGGG